MEHGSDPASPLLPFALVPASTGRTPAELTQAELGQGSLLDPCLAAPSPSRAAQQRRRQGGHPGHPGGGGAAACLSGRLVPDRRRLVGGASLDPISFTRIANYQVPVRA